MRYPLITGISAIFLSSVHPLLKNTMDKQPLPNILLILTDDQGLHDVSYHVFKYFAKKILLIVHIL